MWCRIERERVENRPKGKAGSRQPHLRAAQTDGVGASARCVNNETATRVMLSGNIVRQSTAILRKFVWSTSGSPSLQFTQPIIAPRRYLGLQSHCAQTGAGRCSCLFRYIGTKHRIQEDPKSSRHWNGSSKCGCGRPQSGLRRGDPATNGAFRIKCATDIVFDAISSVCAETRALAG